MQQFKDFCLTNISTLDDKALQRLINEIMDERSKRSFQEVRKKIFKGWK